MQRVHHVGLAWENSGSRIDLSIIVCDKDRMWAKHLDGFCNCVQENVKWVIFPYL